MTGSWFWNRSGTDTGIGSLSYRREPYLEPYNRQGAPPPVV